MSYEVISASPSQKKEIIIEYLLTHSNSLQRTQINIMKALGMSQATLVKYLAELKGEGLIGEKPFGTAVVYEIPYDIAIARGLGAKYEIFDSEKFLAATNQQINQEWTGRVFKFGGVVYIHARHRDGFTIGIPIYDKDWKEVVQAVTLGLNLGAVITAIADYFAQG